MTGSVKNWVELVQRKPELRVVTLVTDDRKFEFSAARIGYDAEHTRSISGRASSVIQRGDKAGLRFLSENTALQQLIDACNKLIQTEGALVPHSVQFKSSSVSVNWSFEGSYTEENKCSATFEGLGKKSLTITVPHESGKVYEISLHKKYISVYIDGKGFFSINLGRYSDDIREVFANGNADVMRNLLNGASVQHTDDDGRVITLKNQGNNAVDVKSQILELIKNDQIVAFCKMSLSLPNIRELSRQNRGRAVA